MINKIRFITALIIGKFIFFGLRLRGSRGTALPGLIAEKIDPNFLATARTKFRKVVIVTGTNGKTSTQTVLAKLLIGLGGERVLVNSRGANLSRGLVSEIIKQFSLFNNYFAYAVFEVEEATLPRIITQLKPDAAVVTNFFRDQLDAYGEINRTKAHVRGALAQMSDMVVIANGDDPQVLDCLTGVPAKQTVLVSINDAEKFITYEPSDREHESFAIVNAKKVLYSTPRITANLGTELEWKEQTLSINLPGFHSVYAVALALEAAQCVLPAVQNLTERVKEIIATIPPAFGRGEMLPLKTKTGQGRLNQDKLKQVQIFLVKNPVGFNVTLDLIEHLDEPFSLVILVNDNIADGRDVSWLWDSELEKLGKLQIKNITYGGSRGLDMQLRVKYAIKNPIPQEFIPDLKALVTRLNQADQENIKVIATYTAMNQFRDLLS